MEFDSYLAQILSLLARADRGVWSLTVLTKGGDYDTFQKLVEDLETLISTFPENVLRKCHLFLLVNTDPWDTDCEEFGDMEWGHFAGIAPTISSDLYFELSCKFIPFQEFLFEAIALMPLPVAIRIAHDFTFSVHHLPRSKFQLVAKKIHIFFYAICHNILTVSHKGFLKSFVDLLDTTVAMVRNELSRLDTPSYLTVLKASLSASNIFYAQKSLFEGNRWKEFYGGSVDSYREIGRCLDRDTFELVQLKSHMCVFFESGYMSEKVKVCALENESMLLYKEVCLLAYECLSHMKNEPPSYHPNFCDSLKEFLSSIAQKPRTVTEEIEEADLSTLCENACLEGGNQLLWIKALFDQCQELKEEKGIRVLSTLVHQLDSGDILSICEKVVSSTEKLSNSSETLVMNGLTKLKGEEKLSLLKRRIELIGSSDIFDVENCELHILETLNRMVAQQHANCQDQLVELAFKSPQLVVRHILLKAVQNDLFSTSVAPKILEDLECVFTCPLAASTSAEHGSSNLTELFLSEIMFASKNIAKECEGIQSLLKQLLTKKIVDVEFFLRSCVFPLLYIHAKDLKESTTILLLQLLLDVQIGVPGWERSVKPANLLALLGHHLECTTRNTNVDNSESILVREIIIRNIQEVFNLPHFFNVIKDAEIEWLLKELSVLSPENCHYFSVLKPEWMLFHGEDRTGMIITLSTVLPHLHVTEWHQLLKGQRRHDDDDESQNFEEALIFCQAVNVIVSGFNHRKQAKLSVNLKSCVRNLASIVKSCFTRGFACHHAPQILEELLHILQSFPEPEQFDVAVFVLPLMSELIAFGCRNEQLVTAFGQILLATRVRCVRRDLGRQLKTLAENVVDGNGNSLIGKIKSSV